MSLHHKMLWGFVFSKMKYYKIQNGTPGITIGKLLDQIFEIRIGTMYNSITQLY